MIEALLTIATAVSFHNFLHLPPVIGMLTGLSYLKFFAYYLKRTGENHLAKGEDNEDLGSQVAFDIFRSVARAEWDTLFFFCGVVLCVGGLGFIGYLALLSETMYLGWGPTAANTAIGVMSSVVDNIPVMFAVLTMMPDMSIGQWMLVTLDRRRGRLDVVHRLRRRRGPHGPGARRLHLLRPPQMDTGDRGWLCGEHPHPHVAEQRDVLSPIPTIPQIGQGTGRRCQ